MRVPNETQKIVNDIWTVLHPLPDGRILATIPLPSIAEYRYSAAKVRVTKDGYLIRSKGCAFIKEPTYDELKVDFTRNMMRQNYELLKKSAYNFRFWLEMLEWMKYCINECDAKVIRLFYGGDFYLNLPHHLGVHIQRLDEIMKHIPNENVQVIVRTSNVGEADKEYCRHFLDKPLDPRIRIVAETQGYDAMPLYIKDRVRYHWHHEHTEGAVKDIDALPVDMDQENSFFNREVQIEIPQEAYEVFSQKL